MTQPTTKLVSVPTPCYICGTPNGMNRRRFPPLNHVLCPSCHAVASRRFNARRGRKRTRLVEVASRQEWVEVLKSAWDSESSAYRCMLTGIRLNPSDPASPLYPTLEHSTPGTGVGGWMVVAAAVNDMKSDLDLTEFRAALPLLTRLIMGTRSNEDREGLERVLRNLRHWRRVVVNTKNSATVQHE
jgi:hypothetical protein